MTGDRRRGRPVLGAVAGLFFGFFLGLTLLAFGVVALDSFILVLGPLVAVLAGVAWGITAPLGRRA